ncbi:vanadium-dependent haloperoxidase [Niastella populi]|nr:vanadium-dependent haloperoxidase [Niastella populi]
MLKESLRLFDMSNRCLETGAGIFSIACMQRIGKYMLLVILLLGQQRTIAQPTAVKARVMQKSEAAFTRYLQPAVFSLSKIMMHDVVNPPAAARYYAYCMLGAYEIISQNDSTLTTLNNLLKQYERPLITTKRGSYDPRIAAIYCIMETGRLMLPSGYRLQEEEEQFIAQQIKARVPRAMLDSSVAVANYIAAKMAGYAKADRYGKLSAQLRYTPVKGDSYWYPTPPAYMEAVEPNWKTIRPLVIDSCNQFLPKPPVVFSKDSASEFYKMAKEVYDVSVKPTEEQLNIASFWDCNPFVVATSGHMMIGFKKISPGGHWMNIAGIAAQQAHLSFNATITVQMLTGITIHDAFISCWDEKYRSNRIRPETYINRYINIKWQPLLQTPPFPEYTSGHSVVSTAAAEVLTYMLGDKLTYTDNSEEIFEIPARTFTSFRQAADEAAVSRLYGGIHYRDAIVNGQDQGREVGMFIVGRLKAVGMKPVK